MTETTAIYSLSGLFSCGLGVLLYIAAGVLLMMAGRWLSKRKPEFPGLLLFACYGRGVRPLRHPGPDLPAVRDRVPAALTKKGG